MTMRPIIGLSIVSIASLLGFNIPAGQTSEIRHHGAHEHGVAHMNVALEGNPLYIELTSPAANIAGLEHHPHSEFRAEYHFVCNKPEKLKFIDVGLFRTFPGIERIMVQLLTATKKTALELKAGKNRILF